MKKCTKCEASKAFDHFHANAASKDGLMSWCKPCKKQQREQPHDKALRALHRQLLKSQIQQAGYGRQYRAKPEAKARKKATHLALYTSSPSYKLGVLLRRRLLHALKGGAKSGSSVTLLGCTVDQARQHIESQFQDGMTWDNWTIAGWHVDHIRPLDSFNLEIPEQLAVACHYTNLQPLWASDNLSKGSKYT